VDWRPILGVVAGLLVAWLLLVVILWIVRPRDARLADLLRLVPDVVRLVRRLIGDRSVPFGARAALVGLLAWLVSPIDLIPEFVPLLGPLDDVVVAIIVLRYVRRRLGDERLRSYWAGSPEGYALLERLLGVRR
jgi:uncharacterized membrane protein YkvA (DUF1232 family)